MNTQELKDLELELQQGLLKIQVLLDHNENNTKNEPIKFAAQATGTPEGTIPFPQGEQEFYESTLEAAAQYKLTKPLVDQDEGHLSLVRTKMMATVSSYGPITAISPPTAGIPNLKDPMFKLNCELEDLAKATKYLSKDVKIKGIEEITNQLHDLNVMIIENIANGTYTSEERKVSVTSRENHEAALRAYEIPEIKIRQAIYKSVDNPASRPTPEPTIEDLEAQPAALDGMPLLDVKNEIEQINAKIEKLKAKKKREEIDNYKFSLIIPAVSKALEIVKKEELSKVDLPLIEKTDESEFIPENSTNN
jgi:hypothetical protein